MTRASANVSGEDRVPPSPAPAGFRAAPSLLKKLASATGARAARGGSRRRRKDLNRVMHKVINGACSKNFFATPRPTGPDAASPACPFDRASVDGVADGGRGCARRRTPCPDDSIHASTEREQRVGVGGLGEVVVEAGVARALAIGGLAVAGERDQHDARVCGDSRRRRATS